MRSSIFTPRAKASARPAPKLRDLLSHRGGALTQHTPLRQGPERMALSGCSNQIGNEAARPARNKEWGVVQTSRAALGRSVSASVIFQVYLRQCWKTMRHG